jgi:hypothetical protein
MPAGKAAAVERKWRSHAMAARRSGSTAARLAVHFQVRPNPLADCHKRPRACAVRSAARTKERCAAEPGAFAFKLVLCILLIPRLGIDGAAAAAASAPVVESILLFVTRGGGCGTTSS